MEDVRQYTPAQLCATFSEPYVAPGFLTAALQGIRLRPTSTDRIKSPLTATGGSSPAQKGEAGEVGDGHTTGYTSFMGPKFLWRVFITFWVYLISRAQWMIMVWLQALFKNSEPLCNYI